MATVNEDIAYLSDIPSVPVASVNGKTGEVTLTGADIAVSESDETTIDAALAGGVQHVWSNLPSVPNRFVDGNRQYGFAARTWTRSDTGESYDYAGLDTSTGLHTWYTQGKAKKLTYSPSNGEVRSDGYLIATLASRLNLWAAKIAPIELDEDKVFTYTDTPSYHIIGTFAFLSDIPSVPVKSVNGKTGEVALTGTDIAVSGTDATKIDVALAGKASKSDAKLTPRYADEWIVNPVYPPGTTSYTAPGWNSSMSSWHILFYAPGKAPAHVIAEGTETSTELTFANGTTATRQSAEHTFLGYQLGSQANKLLASEAEA